MMKSVSQLNGSTITATDGEIGHVKEVYFDDQAWAIRYLVVDTGSWLSGREVLISPYAVTQPLDAVKNVNVALTRQQVENSPNIDTHQPISRRHEREYLDYYAYPAYWGGDALWAMSAMPLIPPTMQTPLETQAERARIDEDVPPEDAHLRSSANVSGYDIQATDDSIGHVQDFVFDDESWAIRYLVIDTRNWWPGGRKVLVGTHWIDRIDWADKTVFVKLTREQIKNSPQYEEGAPIDRAYEERLHDAYDRKGYWD
jgi:uncharacterized protein YrrD